MKVTYGKMAAMHEQTILYRRFQEYLEDIDVLICPATGITPFPVDQLYCGEIDGVKLSRFVSWVGLTFGLTLTGSPVAVIPCGRDHIGAPFGIQICGSRRADRFVLQVALALERLFSEHPELSRPIPESVPRGDAE